MALRRELFPVTRQFVFLNNAAESPLNTATHARIQEYLATALAAPHTRPAAVRQEVRELLAELLGGRAEDFALTSGTAQGVNMVAAGIDWRAGDNVVVPDGEHWSNTFPWLELRARGVEVRVVPLAADRAVLPESVEALVDERTRVVSTAHVQFATGHRCDLRRLSAIAHRRGALLVVDGIQGAGAVPLNLVEDGVDVYAAGGFKWLLGMPGTGFLYVNAEARRRIRPSAPGMFAAGASIKEVAYHDDARRFEGGSIAYSLHHGWCAGLRVLKEVGVQAIFERNQRLTGLLLEGLTALPHVRLMSPVADAGARSQIVAVTLGSVEANRELCERLLAKGVVVANRGDTVRISPNFFNTEEEIATLLGLLAAHDQASRAPAVVPASPLEAAAAAAAATASSSAAAVDDADDVAVGDFFAAASRRFVTRSYAFGEDVVQQLECSEAASTDFDQTGQIVWPSARLLSHFVARRLRSTALAGQHVLELGAGCGLAGLVAAHFAPASVTLTDNEPEVLAILRVNAARHAAPGVDCRCEDLDWGSAAAHARLAAASGGRARWRVILAADVVYWRESIEPLFDTITALLDDEAEGVAGAAEEEEEEEEERRRAGGAPSAAPSPAAAEAAPPQLPRGRCYLGYFNRVDSNRVALEAAAAARGLVWTRVAPGDFLPEPCPPDLALHRELMAVYVFRHGGARAAAAGGEAEGGGAAGETS